MIFSCSFHDISIMFPFVFPYYFFMFPLSMPFPYCFSMILTPIQPLPWATSGLQFAPPPSTSASTPLAAFPFPSTHFPATWSAWPAPIPAFSSSFTAPPPLTAHSSSPIGCSTSTPDHVSHQVTSQFRHVARSRGLVSLTLPFPPLLIVTARCACSRPHGATLGSPFSNTHVVRNHRHVDMMHHHGAKRVVQMSFGWSACRPMTSLVSYARAAQLSRACRRAQ